jgi:hypothetical protein
VIAGSFLEIAMQRAQHLGYCGAAVRQAFRRRPDNRQHRG